MLIQKAEHGLARFSNRIRLSFSKLIYEGFSGAMMRDQSWQEPLFQSLAPRDHDRIVAFGPGSGWTATILARRFSTARIVAVDKDPTSLEKAQRVVVRHRLANVRIVADLNDNHLSFDAGSFDKAVCVLAFHDLPPEGKRSIASELRRVLRHGGSLHVADYDKPTNANEQRILKFAERISGPAAAAARLNGSWTDCLAKAGFVGIRRQSAHSVVIGLVSIIRARKL